MPDDRYPPLVVIYQQVEAVMATKHKGPFAVGKIGKGFVHEFEQPAAALGVAGGAVLICKDGQSVPLPHNTVLLVGNHNLFGYRLYKK